jgi:CheY-like chemotaxis protein
MHEEADRFVVSVRDDGVGIDAKLLPHIFELFTQGERSPDRAQGGLGLGLALVRSLVTLHDGTIEASSAGQGHGSTFTFCLPRHDGAGTGERTRAKGAIPSAPQTGLKVMVVDDNIDAADTLAMLLNARGHQVYVAYSGAEAVQCARKQKPQVFLLDIGLPDIDGYELARRLREEEGGSEAVLIALSGYGQAQDHSRSKAAGFNHHLVKPAGALEVTALLEQLVTEKAGG